MKLSIIISIYQSHEIVRRYIEYFRSMNLSDDVEIIFVDDYSTPHLQGELKNLTILRTDNNIAWTQGLGRNLGVSKARGEYLFFTDIDHIISKEAIDDALNFNDNKMIFRRQIGVLLEDGSLSQDNKILKDYGWKGDKLDASVHGNTFVIKKEIFEQLGGYEPKHSLVGYHPVSRRGDDCYFNSKWNHTFKGIKSIVGSDIFMFPIGRWHKDGDLNPKGLFHNLSQSKQHKFLKGEKE